MASPASSSANPELSPSSFPIRPSRSSIRLLRFSYGSPRAACCASNSLMASSATFCLAATISSRCALNGSTVFVGSTLNLFRASISSSGVGADRSVGNPVIPGGKGLAELAGGLELRVAGGGGGGGGGSTWGLVSLAPMSSNSGTTVGAAANSEDFRDSISRARAAAAAFSNKGSFGVYGNPSRRAYRAAKPSSPPPTKTPPAYPGPSSSA